MNFVPRPTFKLAPRYVPPLELKRTHTERATVMDVRSTERQRTYEMAQGSPLYSAPRRHINPSATGGHIQEEIGEVTRWANQQLSQAGHSQQLVTDLGVDMADGITLLRLVQAVANEPLPRHFPNPMMRVQKLENLQHCMRFLSDKGIPLQGVHAEEIVGGNIKSILAVCHALKRQFTGGASPKTSPTHPISHTHSRGRSRGLSFSSLDRDDMALLSWLGEVVHRDIPSYSTLYDGKILCELMNEVQEGAIPLEAIALKAPEERLKLALAAGERYLLVPQGSLDVRRLPSGQEDQKLKAWIQQCRAGHQQPKGRSQLRQGHRSQGQTSRHQSHPHSPTRQEAFESLRATSGAASLESREAAKVAQRSYEGIRRQKLNQEEQKGRTKRTQSLESSSKPPPGRKHSSPAELLPPSAPGPPRSSSTGNIAAQSRRGRHSTPEQLASSQSESRSSKRPFSGIYISGSSSYGNLSSQKNERAEPAQQRPVVKHSSTEGLGPSSGTQGLGPSSGTQGLGPSSGTEGLGPSSGTQGSISSGSGTQHDLGLHPSTDSGMVSGLGRKTSGPASLSASWNVGSSSNGGTGTRSGYDSDDIIAASRRPSGKTGQSSVAPRRSRSETSTPTPSPTSPLPAAPPTSAVLTRSLSRSTELTNQPTFEPFGGRGMPRRSGSYSRLDSSSAEELSSQVTDLQERVSVLSAQFLFSKADLTKQLHKMVLKERRKRQAMERRLKRVEGVAQQLVQHYDSCFIQLAKEVSTLRACVEQSGVLGTAGPQPTAPHVSREIAAIKQQLSALTRHLSTADLTKSRPQLRNEPHTHTQAELSRVPANAPDRTTKNPLFLRKRSNTIDIIPQPRHSHGPFLRGSTASFMKLKNFFGEEPPRLEDLNSFLEELGYTQFLPIFKAQHITLVELRSMDGSHLERLGIPLGPRIRILDEVKKLHPLDSISDVI